MRVLEFKQITFTVTVHITFVDSGLYSILYYTVILNGARLKS